MREETLRVERVTLRYNGNVSLDNINFNIYKGEVMGMIFLTSQGKQELIELLYQNTPINNGRIYINGQLVNTYQNNVPSGPNRIPIIGRDVRLIETLTVADNIFVMRRGLKKYLINRRLLESQFYFWFEELNTGIDPNALISDLSKAERCMVELFRAIVAGSKLIIIQEIASFLTSDDLCRFYELIQYYKQQGISFLYIGNHHEEVFRICDRVSLMKNARVIRIFEKDELNDINIRPYTISFDVRENHTKEPMCRGVLNFAQVTTNAWKQVSFSIKKGECVVFLDNSNECLSDFLELVCYQKQPISGKVFYDSFMHQNGIKKHWIEDKILQISENPVKDLIFWNLNYMENLCFLIDRKAKNLCLSKHVVESIKKEYKSYVGDEIETENLRTLDIRSLYNLIYYRVHLFNPNLLICIQPFSGLDMYMRRHVVGLLYELQKKGITIIIWSVNLSDCLSVADRLFLLEKGQIKRTYEKEEFYYFREKR
ncbi:MAG: ribose transport system ATP-binding protein [Clostridiales bacterium]|nr:ribose transport system ATP-binding protein [Clostridiales bacterium]